MAYFDGGYFDPGYFDASGGATTVESSFSANAVIKREQAESFGLSAYVVIPQTGSFSVDAWFLKPRPFDADALFKRTTTLSRGQSVGLNKTVTAWGNWAPSNPRYANDDPETTYTDSSTGSGVLWGEYTSGWAIDLREPISLLKMHLRNMDGWDTSYPWDVGYSDNGTDWTTASITQRSNTADGFYGGGFADSNSETLDIPSSIGPRRYWRVSHTATYSGYAGGWSILDWALIPVATTLDAVIAPPPVTGNFTASSVIQSTRSLDFGISASIRTGTTATWTTPINHVHMDNETSLAFLIPTSAYPMHFQIDLDTVNTFDSGNLRTVTSLVSQVGWEYWTGAGWDAIPAAGVSPSFSGNEARYTIQVPLADGTWYRRVRAGNV